MTTIRLDATALGRPIYEKLRFAPDYELARFEGRAPEARESATVVQIGPCTATGKAGPALLGDALNRCAGKPVFVDIPLDNAEAVKVAESNGLAVQRPFTRMSWGRTAIDNPQASWASSGAEKG